jgi:nucleoid-associated protein YgaU
MTHEKIAVLVVTVVIAVLLSLTLLSSPGTPVTETAELKPQDTSSTPTLDQSAGTPFGMQDVLDGRTATQMQSPPKPAVAEVVGPPAELALSMSHRVASGETLDVIAKKLYGRSSAASEILAANPGLNPRRMKVGMELTLPRPPTLRGRTLPTTAAVAPTTAPSASAARTETAALSKEHVVRSKESLGSIAKARYGTQNAWRRIYEANRDKLKSPDKLVVGMKLRLP